MDIKNALMKKQKKLTFSSMKKKKNMNLALKHVIHVIMGEMRK